MIRRLALENFGVHESIALDFPPGRSEVAGQSKAGKSTLLDALCFVLAGTDSAGDPLPTTWIREGSGELSVGLSMFGSEFIRGMDSKRATKRSIRRKPKPEEAGLVQAGELVEDVLQNEAQWTARLAKLGQNPEAVRLVLVPGAGRVARGWRALADSELGGKKLRDALVRILPTGKLEDEVKAILGASWRENDPLDSKTAGEKRAQAKKRRDEANGALEEAKRRTTSTSAATPTYAEDQLAAARAILADADQAKAHQHRTDWLARKATLGDKPAVIDGATITARKAREVAESTVRELGAVRDHALAAVGVAQAAVTGVETAPDDELVAAKRKQVEYENRLATLKAGVCRHCHKPTAAQDELDIAEAAVKSSTLFADGLAETNDERLSQRIAAATEKLGKAKAKLETAEASLKTAQETLEKARTEALAADAARENARKWKVAFDALGAEPADVPTAPTAPTDEAIAAARELLTRAERAVGAREVQEQASTAAATALATATTTAAAWEAEAARCELLVEAVRKAPSLLVEKQLSALGNLGPVSLRFEERGGVTVLVNGRPHTAASDGELVVADVWLRMGIRRALGMDPPPPGVKRGIVLPLFVDNAQDVGALEWPEMPGQVVFLRTSDVPIAVRELA